ncbi:MAG TPA: undecaprenyl-diphosphate phosphatase [Candidatus Paceibacterota bacterium]
MDLIYSIILGVIEGFTEFLPVSSTGHLILASRLFGIGQTDFTKTFEVVIQFGAILSVVVLYWSVLRKNIHLIGKVIFAFIPTAIVGLLLYDFIKNVLFAESVTVWALLIGGVVLIIFELLRKDDGQTVELDQVSYKQAFWIGVSQSIAIIPGVSRAAATILGGMIVGLRRKVIVEFSFLLAVPTMAAASGLDLLKNMKHISDGGFHVLAVGFVVSFLMAILSIKFLLKVIQKHSFVPFGIYRIILGLVFLFSLSLIT